MRKWLVSFVVLLVVGCTKKSAEPVPRVQSDKRITAVVFRWADNPGLSTDIAGIVSSDSVKFEVPPYTAINSLIPTISFTGKKIEPANRTAQDFTNGVRFTITAEDGSTNSYFFRVTRHLSDTATLVLGTWKLIKDSVTNNNWINPAGGNLNPGVYTGTSLDYWKFDQNGVFSARENNITGTSTYSILPNNKLDIPAWSVQYGPGTIETLTADTFTVYFSATSSNGGQYFRKVYLKR